MASREISAIWEAAKGKETIIQNKDGKYFRGLFYGYDETGIKLIHCYEVNEENRDNLLPLAGDMIKQLVVPFIDIISTTFAPKWETETEKMFRTDAQYHGSKAAVAEREFEEWNGHDEELPNRATTLKNEDGRTGWSPDAMFASNRVLGVQSTYVEGHKQYTNVEIGENPELLARAERIAREIEASNTSKHRAMLENDDEERDIKKWNRNNRPNVEYNERAEALRGNGRPSKGNERKPMARRNPADSYESRDHSDSRNSTSSISERETFGNGPTKDEKVGNEEQAATTSSNAWTRGPPQGLVSSPVSSNQPSPVPKTDAKESASKEEDKKGETDGAEQRETPESAASGDGEAKGDSKKSEKKFTFNPNAAAFVPTKKPEAVEVVQIGSARGPHSVTTIPNYAMQPSSSIIQQNPVLYQYAGVPPQPYQTIPPTFAQYTVPAAQQPRAQPLMGGQHQGRPQAQPVFVPGPYAQVYPTGVGQNVPVATYFPGAAYPGGQVQAGQEGFIQQLPIQTQQIQQIGYIPQSHYQGTVPQMQYVQTSGTTQRFPSQPQRNGNGMEHYAGAPAHASQPQTPVPQANGAQQPAHPPQIQQNQPPAGAPPPAPSTASSPPFVIAPAQAPLFYGNQQMYFQQPTIQHVRIEPGQDVSFQLH
ncbi:unnamed protein product, partial [Mesorhabditis spiculigera]